MREMIDIATKSYRKRRKEKKKYLNFAHNMIIEFTINTSIINIKYQ